MCYLMHDTHKGQKSLPDKILIESNVQIKPMNIKTTVDTLTTVDNFMMWLPFYCKVKLFSLCFIVTFIS